MGGRELNEDLQKLQKLTGETSDICFKAFVHCNHDIQKAAEYINSRAKDSLFDFNYE